jgi:probable rRNA maturation factor
MSNVKTFLQNKQTRPLNLSALLRLTAKLAAQLEAADPDSAWKEVTLLLTDDAGITQYNREFFGKNSPTDVISFRSDPFPGEDGTTGDLIVNIERAVQEGPHHDGVNAELALYIAHGFDHLSGAEDDTPARRAAMRRTELRWLADLKAEIKKLDLG